MWLWKWALCFETPSTIEDKGVGAADTAWTRKMAVYVSYKLQKQGCRYRTRTRTNWSFFEKFSLGGTGSHLTLNHACRISGPEGVRGDDQGETHEANSDRWLTDTVSIWHLLPCRIWPQEWAYNEQSECGRVPRYNKTIVKTFWYKLNGRLGFS